ncbi:MAG: serine hydrolase domain-containing protein [Dokdonella sp.]|uniref:serine hydrolase domain-containing protein n=1 Tax=Dokdonella sp. TaxID=2291710 RepID=UPI003262FBEF
MPSIRIKAAAVLLIAVAASSARIAHAAPTAPDAVAEVAAKAHEAGRFDGLIVLDRGNTRLYSGRFGDADRATHRPHTTDERWRWASITKQVTAVLVMQQVERGRLRLDDVLADALPGFGTPAIAAITLRQLLQHTSGLANPDDTPTNAAGVPSFYRGATMAGHPVPGVCAGPMKHAAGERFDYNNCDYLVLAAVLERLTGLSYAAQIERRIAKPLGLKTLAPMVASARPARDRVTGYLADGRPEPRLDIGRYGAAGALYGTVDDLLRFDRALVDGTLLSASSTDLMWKGEPKFGYVALGAWSYSAKLARCAAPVDIVERQGGIGGIHTINVLAPKQHVVLIAFSNTAATDWGQVWQGSGLLYDLLDAALCAGAPPADGP